MCSDLSDGYCHIRFKSTVFGDVLLAADCGCFPLDVAIESRIGVASVRLQ